MVSNVLASNNAHAFVSTTMASLEFHGASSRICHDGSSTLDKPRRHVYDEPGSINTLRSNSEDQYDDATKPPLEPNGGGRSPD